MREVLTLPCFPEMRDEEVARVAESCAAGDLSRRAAGDCRAILFRAALAEKDPLIEVTGTVPDIRPYLWRSGISIVPLRIGGGTRLKIYESMAGRTPVVSTTVGAEGLQVHPPNDIRIADSPESFASACLELLSDSRLCERQAAAAWEMVAKEFSWEHVAGCFDRILCDAQEFR